MASALLLGGEAGRLGHARNRRRASRHRTRCSGLLNNSIVNSPNIYLHRHRARERFNGVATRRHKWLICNHLLSWKKRIWLNALLLGNGGAADFIKLAMVGLI